MNIPFYNPFVGPPKPLSKALEVSKAISAPSQHPKNVVLIVLRHLQIGDRQFRTGEELPPGLLPREAIDLHLDRRELAEVGDRRSLYRIFYTFTGSEREGLSSEEYREFAL